MLPSAEALHLRRLRRNLLGVLSEQDLEGNRNPQGGAAEAEERAAAGRMESPEAVPEQRRDTKRQTLFRTKLSSAPWLDEKTQYPMVQLKEPPKEVVLAWKTGQAIRREAFLVVKKGAQTFEAVVDVNEKKLLSWTERKGVQPNMTNEELQGIDGPVKDNPEVQAALKRRGITDLATVSCGVYAMDYFGALQGSGRRLVHLTCSQQYGPLEDWGPIE